MTEGKREHCRLVRSSELAWVSLASTLAVLGFLYAPLVVEIAGTDEPWLVVILLPFLLPTVWVSWRVFRIGVRVCANEARLVTMRKTIVVPWADIDHFSLGGSFLNSNTGIAHLRSGEQIGILGIASPNRATRPKNRSAERLIEELNAELCERVPARSMASPGTIPS